MASAKRPVGSGIDRQIPVGAGGSARAIRINDYQLRALAPRFLDERPQMNVVAVNVRSPGDDVARVNELFRLGAQFHAENRDQTSLARCRTDCALKLRCAEPVEKSAIHGSAVQCSKRSTVGVRKNGLAAEFRSDLAKSGRDFVERLIPGDALPGFRHVRLCGDSRPRLSMRSEASPSLRRDPSHRIEHAIRRVDPIEILRHFRAQKSPRHRMRRIALNLRRPPIFDCDQHSASIRAIVRTGGVNDLLGHRAIISGRTQILAGTKKWAAICGRPVLGYVTG